MIPVNEPLLADEDFQLLKNAFESGWISSAGAYVEEFEEVWSSYCGVKHGIAVSNGTTALQIAVEAVGVSAGDEVIMPTYTIISCANAVIRAGAKPVLIDCDPDTWCMKVDQIERAITSKTKAIMVVHIFGHPVDMDPIMDLAAKYDLVVIEDAAEVHGALYKSKRFTDKPRWQKCGGIGHIATFSFFANKLITTGEGGMVVTDNDQYAEKARSLINLCFRPDRRFLHTELGHQFRITNMQCAVGVNQVKRIEDIVARKRWIAAEYTDRLQKYTELQLPYEHDWARNVYWVYALVLSDNIPFDASIFTEKLREQGIETRPFFLGMHSQPVLTDLGLFEQESYPVSDRIASRGLYLPSGLALTLKQIDEVSMAVAKIIGPYHSF